MNLSALKMFKSMAVNNWHKAYVTAAMLIVTFYVNPSISFAATDKGNCTKSSFSVPDWLFNSKGLIEDPAKWLQWIAGILLPLFLLMAFFKIKSSKGNQQKIDDGMKMIYIVIGSDVAIFGVASLATWALGKLC